MNAAVMTVAMPRGGLAQTALIYSARSWFVVAFVGHALFAAYIAITYGYTAVTGDFNAWNNVLPTDVAPGQFAQNAAIVAHLLFALVVTVGGPLQLIPAIRRKLPRFHRWNGRTYAITAAIASLSGLYMVWTGPKAIGDFSQQVAISGNAILILVCVAMAWRAAVERDIANHESWALRLFLCVSGVWFFRVGLMLWLTVWRAPVGFDPESFAGPTLTALGFAQYLVPLAVLELYRRARNSAADAPKATMATVMALATVATAVGIFGAAAGMWLPRVSAVF